MMAVRIIHTQAQAQAELDRLRAAQKASDTRRKERMLNDPIYREEVLQRRQTSRDQKRKAIENDPHHLDARKDADRKAKARKIARESQEAMDALEQEEMIEKVHQRYFSYSFPDLTSFRIAELDAQFADLQVKEQLWPGSAPDVMPMYKGFLTHTYKLGQNIVCTCCGCIYHDIMEFEVVPQSYDPLRHLRIPEDANIPFDFSCGINVLDQNHILIDKLGITQDKRILLC